MREEVDRHPGAMRSIEPGICEMPGLVLIAHIPEWRLLEWRQHHRQCSNRASSMLISFPTANPNSDRITTPANS